MVGFFRILSWGRVWRRRGEPIAIWELLALESPREPASSVRLHRWSAGGPSAWVAVGFFRIFLWVTVWRCGGCPSGSS